jgi:hypothetical protein
VNRKRNPQSLCTKKSARCAPGAALGDPPGCVQRRLSWCASEPSSRTAAAATVWAPELTATAARVAFFCSISSSSSIRGAGGYGHETVTRLLPLPLLLLPQSPPRLPQWPSKLLSAACREATHGGPKRGTNGQKTREKGGNGRDARARGCVLVEAGTGLAYIPWPRKKNPKSNQPLKAAGYMRGSSSASSVPGVPVGARAIRDLAHTTELEDTMDHPNPTRRRQPSGGLSTGGRAQRSRSQKLACTAAVTATW